MTDNEYALKTLKNMGHDITCGTCMAIAFTGTSTGTHTCKQYKPKLYNADPNCEHEIQELWSGIKCKKCPGWFCY